MRTVCIYTSQHRESVQSAAGCVDSGRRFGIEVELFKAVWFQTMHEVHEKYGLKLKYEPVAGSKTDYGGKLAPRTRIANGTSHYLLYRWAVKHDRALHILEHDALIIGQPPQAIYDGVIQTSSHTLFQMTPAELWDSLRCKKMLKHEPEREYNWNWDADKGVITHPLSGTNGTSGYVIGPGAAAKMVAYIEADGIANADRLRTAHIGEGNIYLQHPQSVFCAHGVKSHRL
jgi:hypothetical protein